MACASKPTPRGGWRRRASNSPNRGRSIRSDLHSGGDLSNYATPGTMPGDQSAIGYARIIVPLGSSPKRLDCARLYDLEIARLKAEIEMLKVGLE